jgi:hypothetical protein
LAFLGLLALTAACSTSGGPPPRADAGTGSGSLTSADSGPGTDGPIAIDPATPAQCQQLWTVAQLPRPWWLDAPPTACSDHLVHQPPQAYDDCGDTLTRAADHDPASCHFPAAGLWTCDSGSGDIWLTQTCVKSTDCPEGMACSTGLCVQRCDPGGPDTCVRSL